METSTKIKKRTQIEISFHHFFLRIQTKIHQFSNYENQAQLWKLSQESTMKNLAMKHHEKPSYENEDLTNPLNPNWTTTGQQIKNNNPSTQTDLQPQQHQYQFDLNQNLISQAKARRDNEVLRSGQWDKGGAQERNRRLEGQSCFPHNMV